MTLSEGLLESNKQFIAEAETFPEALRRKRPKPGAFSATEIVYHMVAVEELWSKRFAKLLAEGHHMFEAMNPDLVAVEEAHNEKDFAEGIALFRRLRIETAKKVAAFSDDTLQISGEHPRYGTLSVIDILEIIRKHDLQHKAQLERTRQELTR